MKFNIKIKNQKYQIKIGKIFLDKPNKSKIKINKKQKNLNNKIKN